STPPRVTSPLGPVSIRAGCRDRGPPARWACGCQRHSQRGTTWSNGSSSPLMRIDSRGPSRLPMIPPLHPRQGYPAMRRSPPSMLLSSPAPVTACQCAYVGLTRCETPEAAWAGGLTHGPGPPRRAAGVLVRSRDYRTGERPAGASSLLACRIGRPPVWGGHAPPDWRDASRTRVRSLRSLYTQMWTNLFSPPSSLVQQAARGENFSRASMAVLHPSSTLGMSPEA